MATGSHSASYLDELHDDYQQLRSLGQRVEWLDGDQWKSVAASGLYGVEKDKFNSVPFEPVTTKQLRIVVQLQTQFSGGIIEWRVK